MWNDLRYALRGLKRNPALAAVVVLTLSLGIGVNTTIFCVAEAYFLRPLPGAAPAQLVRLTSRTPQGRDDYFSFPDYRDLGEQRSSFSGILAYSSHAGFLLIHGNSRLIGVHIVSRNYFRVLGIGAIRGRTFSRAPAASPGPSIVLSYYVWRDDFGGDPSLVGKSVNLTGKSYTVIGIAPASFRGLDRGEPTNAWLPVDAWYPAADLGIRSFREFELVGRLKANASAAQARAELGLVASRLAQAYPATNAGRTFGLISERQRLQSALVPTGFLLAATGLVLLIACANVAGLLVAQAENRRREIAIRLAVGAGRWRLLRQPLIESAMLAAAAAALAIFASWLLIRLQPAFMPPAPIQLGADLRVNGSVAVFTLLVAVIAVSIFGLAPAITASKMDVAPALKSEGGRTASRSGRHKLRNIFVVGEVALAVVLTSGAGLLLESLLHTIQANPGFDTHKRILLVDLAPGIAGLNPSQSWQYFERVSSRVAALPGVKDVTFAVRALLSESGGGRAAPVSIPGVEFSQGQPTIDIKFNSVAPGYFRIVGTAILAGRAFRTSDGLNAPKVVIVDEAMARRFGTNGDAIGKTIEVRGTRFQIVGIAEDARIESVHEGAEPYMYFPFAQQPYREGTLIVETALKPEAMAGTIRKELRSVNPGVLIVDTFTMNELLEAALWSDRTAAELAASLSLLGIFLAALGLYGVVAYLVGARTREIGIRVALGAQRGQILRLVVGHGLKLATLGVAAGLIGALAATRLMASLLYGVSARDPAALGASCGLALGIAVVASYIPARRAARVQPGVALRSE
jgi:predicted permease